MNATVYLFIQDVDETILELLEGIYGTLIHTPPLIRLRLSDDEEALTAEALHELLETDFAVPISLLETTMPHALYPDALIAACLSSVPKGHYDLESLFFKISQHAPTLEKQLKARLDSVLTREIIQTLLSFAAHQMNVSVSAKALFMHRNTMHYRLASFTKKTHLNPYRFEVLALLYRWYHH